MKARAFILACGAASLLLPLAHANAAPYQPDEAPPLVHASPRIIHIPEPPKHERRRHVEHPQKQSEPRRQVEQPQQQPESKGHVEQPLQPPEPTESVAPRTAKPTPLQMSPTPDVRRPAQTKSNRKIWI